MRLFEVILITTLVLLLLVVYRKTTGKLGHILSAVTIVVLGIHYLTEGIRWQMYMVYIISFGLIISVFANIRINKRWLRNTLAIIAFIIISISGITGIILPVFKLPEIHSNYTIGTDFLTLTDPSRNNRVLNIKFWYPADLKGGREDIYSQNPSKSLDGLMGFPGFVFSHLKLVKTGAYVKSDVSRQVNKFPLVIYSHGAASANIDNTALLQQIAGNGYVVMAIDYDFSFEAYDLDRTDATTLTLQAQKKLIGQLIDKTVPNQVNDILFSLKEIQSTQFYLSEHIDSHNIAYLGHSLGGTTSINASISVTSPKAVINIDGPVDPLFFNSFKSPFLYISSYSPELSDDDLKNKGLPDVNFYRQVKKYELQNVSTQFEQRKDNAYWVRFGNAGHLDFTDFPIIVPMMATKGYSTQKGHYLKSKIIVDFLNAYLKDDFEFKKSEDDSIEWIK